MDRVSGQWRWVAVVVGLVLLLGAPAAWAHRPLGGLPHRTPAQLLALARGGDDVAWSGYAESTGLLELPDVSQLGSTADLASGTSRLRVWWRSRAEARIDVLSLVGETDTAIADATVGGTWTWDSTRRRGTLLLGQEGFRLPRGADLLPSALGARLARSTDLRAEALPGRRVAGVSALGVRLRPPVGPPTLVDHVDEWLEPRTGLPLAVEVTGTGRRTPSFRSVVRTLHLGVPPQERTEFQLPADAERQVVDAGDLASTVNRFTPFLLPDRLVGLDRLPVAADSGGGSGVASYGSGFTVLTVVPLRARTARTLLDAIAGKDPVTGQRADTGTASTALLSSLVAQVGDRSYLLAGSVPPAVLQQALDALAADPPPVRPGR